MRLWLRPSISSADSIHGGRHRQVKGDLVGDLGFFGLQEVWDYVMDEAGLPPSQVPETRSHKDKEGPAPARLFFWPSPCGE